LPVPVHLICLRLYLQKPNQYCCAGLSAIFPAAGPDQLDLQKKYQPWATCNRLQGVAKNRRGDTCVQKLIICLARMQRLCPSPCHMCPRHVRRGGDHSLRLAGMFTGGGRHNLQLEVSNAQRCHARTGCRTRHGRASWTPLPGSRRSAQRRSCMPTRQGCRRTRSRGRCTSGSCSGPRRRRAASPEWTSSAHGASCSLQSAIPCFCSNAGESGDGHHRSKVCARYMLSTVLSSFGAQAATTQRGWTLVAGRRGRGQGGLPIHSRRQGRLQPHA